MSFDRYLDTIQTVGLASVLATWNMITEYGTRGAAVLNTVLRAVLLALRGEQFVFFKGTTRPYRVRDTVYYATVAPAGEWLYENNTFTQWPVGRQFTRALTARNLPILSMEVVEGEEVHYDLTDFVEQVKWLSEDDNAPSAGHVFEAWSLQSGIVLDSARQWGLRLRCILENAEDIVVAIDDMRPLGEFLEEDDEAEAEAEAVPDTAETAAAPDAEPDEHPAEAEKADSSDAQEVEAAVPPSAMEEVD